VRFVVVEYNTYWGFFEKSVFYYAFYFKIFVGVVSAHFCTLWNIIGSIMNHRRRHMELFWCRQFQIPSLNNKINIKYIGNEKKWEKNVVYISHYHPFVVFYFTSFVSLIYFYDPNIRFYITLFMVRLCWYYFNLQHHVNFYFTLLLNYNICTFLYKYVLPIAFLNKNLK
jgi:hypothetical protein